MLRVLQGLIFAKNEEEKKKKGIFSYILERCVLIIKYFNTLILSCTSSQILNTWMLEETLL